MPLLRLKHEDTRRVVVLMTILLVVSGLGSLISWTVALALFLVLTVAGTFFMIAHYQRASEECRVQQSQDIQDLQFIQSALDMRRPLLYFTRWSSSPALAAQLIGIIQVYKPQRILELGSGVSTVVMAMTLRDQGSGRITSVDHDPVYAVKTRKELAAQELHAWASVLDAPLVPCDTPRGAQPWYDLSVMDDLEQIDLLVVDGPLRKSCKNARLPAFELLRERLAPGAIVVLDDTVRDDESASVASWLSAARDGASRIVPCRKGVTIVQMP
jgi:predicted O-methyltransferase YrrM